jgi:hypothetical protein
MFLTFSSGVAVAVGCFAVVLPQVLLESKGVALPNEAAAVWVRELGVAIFALGVTLFLVRKHAASPTLRAVLYGNALVQLGLLPIEITAHHERVLTRVAGIVPNSLLHVVLALGFLACASRRVGD